MSEYKPENFESKWQQHWEESKLYKAEIHPLKPKFYALDMFPYPSGAGLHVGHPLGYIATDIVARYKRLKGFNVLHPMGFDSFGLPAEQYAIQTGQHPSVTTEENINTYKRQLKSIGFSYDWDREVRTSSPDFYKWTQWIFIKLFHSWYNKIEDKAESIEKLIKQFEISGTDNLIAHCDEKTQQFSVEEWKNFSENHKQEILLNYRLAYLDNMTVNWCPALGTVLANDEVKDGVSERGGYPVVKKEMKQWAMRITAFAGRLLTGLEEIDWPEPLKEMQRNWIGKSFGAELDFQSENNDFKITVFTTRVDTIYGVSYIVIAPESDLVEKITTSEQKNNVDEYVKTAKNRSERDRMSDVKTVSGVFSGSYVINPFNNEKVPVWVADYVLAGYGTGAVMGVPSSDDRDLRFAKNFNLPIVFVIEGTENLEDPTEIKHGKLINSGFLTGMDSHDAILKAISFVEEKKIGLRKINYRMRDAIFARQRYWGEPIPIYYKDGLPYTLPENKLPLELPSIDKYLPTEDGEPPLARAKNWVYSPEGEKNSYPLELNTMPGWAGSSWYWYRYMDPKNENEFASKKSIDYWQDIDIYLGGAEHSTGHLLYSRFWNYFLYDLGLVPKKEFAKKLINQGMIQGVSEKIYRLGSKNSLNKANEARYQNNIFAYHLAKSNLPSGPSILIDENAHTYFVSQDIANYYEHKHSLTPINVPIGYVTNNRLDINSLLDENNHEIQKDAVFIYQSGYYFQNRFTLFNGFDNIHDDFSTKKEKVQTNDLSEKININNVYRLNTRGTLNPEAKTKFRGGIYAMHLEKFPLADINVDGNAHLYYVSDDIVDYYRRDYSPIEILVAADDVSNNDLNIPMFLKNNIDDEDSIFICKIGYYFKNRFHPFDFFTKSEVEKMSKRWRNVVNPDEVVSKYGADTLRLYEMFLGPLEQFKPWNTQGIDGTFKFLRKLWRLFYNEEGKFLITDDEPSAAELKVLHKTIKKVEEDIEKYTFNTVVSSFMICVNELKDLNCNKRAILKDFLIILSPYAPHIAEELWQSLGNNDSIFNSSFPHWKQEYIQENDFEYPISINGKVRTKINFSLETSSEEIEKSVMESEVVKKWLEGKQPKKIIVVQKKIVNVVI